MTATLTLQPTRPRAPSRPPGRLTSLDLVESPRSARRLGLALLVALLGLPVALLFVPWQQSLPASGRITAYDPGERQQAVEAPVDGRVVKWHKREGDRVKAGELLVSIQDPDPDLPQQLARQKEAVLERKKAAGERVAALDKQRKALLASRDETLRGADNRIAMAKERLKAADQAVGVAKLTAELAQTRYENESRLNAKGLMPGLEFLATKQRKEAADLEVLRAGNGQKAADEEVKVFEAERARLRNSETAAIEAANAAYGAAVAELAQVERDLAEIEVRITRQGAQEVKAPVDGTLFRVVANAGAGGMLVKQGDTLGLIVPDIKADGERMVELYLEGYDAPLISLRMDQERAAGREPRVPVRLQFEGWPAVQSVGWPSLAWGTFGGEVVFVDATDDGKGKFRVLVKPDPAEEAENPWPDEAHLRQGARVQGWVLLNRVTLGWELWRQLNGFPPVAAPKGDDADKKPAKIRVPK